MINYLITLAWPCTFKSNYLEGAQRYLSCYLGGANSILIRSHPIPCFMIHPKIVVIATQLRSSVWKPQSAPLRIVKNNGDLKSKDLVGILLVTNWWYIQNNNPSNVSEWVNPTPYSLTCVHIINLIYLYPWSMKCNHQLIHVMVHISLHPT